MEGSSFTGNILNYEERFNGKLGNKCAKIFKESEFGGRRCGIRTHGLWFRRPTLYPSELIAHFLKLFLASSEGFVNVWFVEFIALIGYIGFVGLELQKKKLLVDRTGILW